MAGCSPTHTQIPKVLWSYLQRPALLAYHISPKQGKGHCTPGPPELYSRVCRPGMVQGNRKKQAKSCENVKPLITMSSSHACKPSIEDDDCQFLLTHLKLTFKFCIVWDKEMYTLIFFSTAFSSYLDLDPINLQVLWMTTVSFYVAGARNADNAAHRRVLLLLMGTAAKPKCPTEPTQLAAKRQAAPRPGASGTLGHSARRRGLTFCTTHSSFGVDLRNLPGSGRPLLGGKSKQRKSGR